MSTPPSPSAFDLVEIIDDDGEKTERFTADQFLALPLPQRIGYVIRGRCRFFLRGQPVDAQVALSELRRLSERR